MNWASPAFPMWLIVVAAAFFGLIVIVTLLRAEKSVANGALTIIALLAMGVAVASMIRSPGPVPAAGVTVAAVAPPPAVYPAMPALSCVDDLAGETVLAACEKILFGSAESTAAAVSYAAARLTRLTSFGDVATANKNLTPDLAALRRSVESDRYGLIAHVLLTRDHCTPAECAAFNSLTDHSRIVANMDQQVYDGLITRYALTWNAPVTTGTTAAPSTAMGALAALPPSVPTGRPVHIDFPSSSSTPAVSIMNPEPGSGAPSPSASRGAASAASAAPAQASSPAAKKTAPKPRRTAEPVQIVPAAPAATAPAAPAASNQ
jgi:hypothetical protein